MNKSIKTNEQTKKFINRGLSQGLYADYKRFTSVDGQGFRCSLYVSGCLFACKNCYNKSIQNFGVGKPYTKDLEDLIMQDMSKSYVQGLTLLGGEPMLNTEVCLSVTNRLRKEYGQTKDIWAWTGYTWEQLLESIECNTVGSVNQARLLNNLDVLVDGQYIDEERDPSGTIKFRGSWNQRIIDVQASLKLNKIVERTEFYQARKRRRRPQGAV